MCTPEESDTDTDTELDDDELDETEQLRISAFNSLKDLAVSSSQVEKLASTKVDQAIVDAVKAFGGEYLRSNYEVIADSSTSSARYQFQVSQLKKALSAITDPTKAAARTAFLAAVFDFAIAGSGSGNQADIDVLFAHIFHALLGEAMVAKLDTATETQVKNLVAKWNALSDASYWTILSDYYALPAIKRNNLSTQLALLELTARLKPMSLRDGPHVWANEEAIAFNVDCLVAASKLPPCLTLAGEVNVSAMCRYAARLNFPRAIMAELMRLALAQIATDTTPATLPQSIPDPHSLVRALALETSSSTGRTPQDVSNRNALRQACVQLVSDANTAFGGAGDQSSATDAGLEKYIYRSQARSLRGSLATMHEFYVLEVVAKFDRTFGDPGNGSRVQFFAKGAGISEALSAWDALYALPVVDAVKLKSSLDAVSKALSGFLAKIRTLPQYQGAANPAEAIVEDLKAIAFELSFQAVEMLSGTKAPALRPMEDTLQFIECLGARGQMRLRARLAVLDPAFTFKNKVPCSALSAMVLDYAKLPQTQGTWVEPLTAALDTWRRAASSSAADLVSATQNLTAALSTLRAALPALDPVQGYKAANLIDALVPVIADYLQGIIDTGNPDAMQRLPGCLRALAATRPLIQAEPDLGAYWKAQASALAGGSDTPFAGSRFDLVDALAKWQTALQDPNSTADDVADLALQVAQAAGDYMRRVSGLPNAKKLPLLVALGTILDNIEEALRVRMGP